MLKTILSTSFIALTLFLYTNASAQSTKLSLQDALEVKSDIKTSIIDHKPTTKGAEITFDSESFGFGEVEEGKPAIHEYKFTNTGDEPLIVSSVRPGCGCTTSGWTKEAVPPGGKGMVNASYNTQGRPGGATKSLTVTSNAKSTPTKVLTFSVNVTRVNPSGIPEQTPSLLSEPVKGE